ncbi:hypothetical protein CDCA_CDCA09G2744 [Cyanidium caldarium]|uniref:Uncharacterized protein n=1 Tax=Cyanidium caldarium TaxID=2771 RepID=A0AAV9IX85_CYACA|nr:hypothetical protein CDCA_CDCA09G2744 [Cyanidium caldarium]
MKPVIGEKIAHFLGWYFSKVPFPYGHILLMFMVLFVVNLPYLVGWLNGSAQELLREEADKAYAAREALGLLQQEQTFRAARMADALRQRRPLIA